MKFNTAKDFINSYLNKVEFVSVKDVELPEYEWKRVREYCLDNSKDNPELSALLANLYIYELGGDYNDILAKFACESAMKKGSLNAIFTLGDMYYYGKGFIKSY